jgi:hypothetical protein
MRASPGVPRRVHNGTRGITWDNRNTSSGPPSSQVAARLSSWGLFEKKEQSSYLCRLKQSVRDGKIPKQSRNLLRPRHLLRKNGAPRHFRRSISIKSTAPSAVGDSNLLHEIDFGLGITHHSYAKPLTRRGFAQAPPSGGFHSACGSDRRNGDMLPVA